MDIENGKVDIQDKKVDIDSVLSEKGSDFSVKTMIHIHRLFEKFGFDEVFGRSAGKKFAVDAVNAGADKPIGKWFVPLGKYVLVPLSLVALIAGALLGGIG